MYITFTAHNSVQVNESYLLTLATSVTDNGNFCIYNIYHVDCHGAFIIDSDGHSIEVVYHALE